MRRMTGRRVLMMKAKMTVLGDWYRFDEFYDSHALGTEIESHATYTLLAGNGT